MGRARKNPTIEAYEKLLRQGIGCGEGGSYKPWTNIWSFPSRGRSSAIPGITTGRMHHLFSDGEKRAFLLAEFSQYVIDIREQFPLLPLDHVQSLAAQLDLKYPKVSGVPWVMTTDLLLTLQINNQKSFLAIAVKPAAELRKIEVIEKLEIERVWWESLGVDWVLSTEGDVSEVVANNLAWISSELRGDQSNKYIIYDMTLITNLAKKIEPRRYMLSEIYSIVIKELDIDINEAKLILCKAIWDHILIIDLRISLDDTGIMQVLRWNLNQIDELQSERNELIA